MQRERYDEYVRRFNAEDATAFDEFLAPDMRMQNGTLVYYGVQGMISASHTTASPSPTSTAA